MTSDANKVVHRALRVTKNHKERKRNMQKKIIILSIIIVILNFTKIGYAAKVNKPISIENLYKNLYIGEIFNTGFIYIEPFSVDRKAASQTTEFSSYPNKVSFVPCYKDNRKKFYDATFDSVFKIYVPNTEKDSNYFLQPYSETVQCGLRYKTSFLSENTKLGIASFYNNISNIDYEVEGKKRSFSDLEYQRAKNEVIEDQKIKESERTLSFISLEDTIVGAKQILIIHFNDNPYKIRLSKYSTHGFEYVAIVYVLDILKDGKVVKTYEKYNWDGPY